MNNINLLNNSMALKSAYVGLPQATKETKDTTKQEQPKQIIGVKEEEQTKEGRKSVDQPQSATTRQQAHKVAQRFVAYEAKTSSSGKTEKGEKSAHVSGEQYMPEGMERMKYPLDTSSRIAHTYNSLRKSDGKGAAGDASNLPKETQLKNFLSNLRSYVKMEYQQYVKSDDALYSRKNLRELLGALGDQPKAFDDKQGRKKSTDKVDAGKGYNKYGEKEAARALRIFTPIEEEQHSLFSQVA